MHQFADEEQTRRARQLHIIQWTLAFVFPPAAVVWMLILPGTGWRWLAFLAGVEMLCLVTLWLTRRGQVRLASQLIVLTGWGLTTTMAATAGGVHSAAVNGYFILVLVSGILLGARTGVIMAAVSSLSILGLVYAGQAGVLPPSAVQQTGLFAWSSITAFMAIMVFLQYLAVNSIKTAAEKAQRELAQRRQAEAALRASEAIFSSFMEYSPIYVFFMDKETRTLRLSKTYEQMLGLPVEQMLGKRMDELFPGPLAESMVADDLRILNEGQKVSVVEELNGRIYETTKFPILKDGKAEMLAGFTVDITERRQAEQALVESQALLHAVIENTPDMIWSVDCDLFRLLTFNHSLSDYFLKERGITIYVGMPQEELFPPGPYRELWRRNYGKALDQGAFSTEYTVSSGGRTLMMSLNVLRRGGVPFGVSVFGRDISEQKKAEMAHRDAEERYRQLSEATFEGIVMTDNGTIVDANHQFLQMWGYDLEEILGKRIIELVIPEEHALLEKILLEGKERVQEYTGLRKDGTWFLVEAHGRLIEQSQRRLRVTSIRDITARKQAEEGLRESEERFRTLIEQAPVGIALLRDDRPVYGNPFLLNMLRLESLEDLASRPVHEYFAPPYQEASIERWRLRRQGLTVGTETESIFQKKDGSLFPAHVSTGQIQLPDGPAMITFISDISESKQAEAALRASEERYRLIANNVLDVIWTLDLAGRVTYASPSVIRLSGFTPEEVIAENMQGMLPGIFPNILEIQPLDILRGEFQQPCKDGSRVWTEVSISGLYEESGKLVGFLGLSRDISERKAMEAARRKSEENFAKIFLLGPVSMSINDLGEGNKFIDINESFEHSTGYRREEVIGRGLEDLGLYDDAEMYEKMKATILATGHVRNQEYSFHKKSGEVGTGLLAVEVIEIDGRPCAITSTIDISELKQTREELEASLQQLHILSNHQQTIRENERSAIAREIHDELGQALTGLKMELYWLKETQARSGAAGAGSLVAQKLASAITDVDRTIDLVRQISTSLRPSILDTLGLVPALEWLAHDFEARYAVVCSFRSTLEEEDFSQNFATAAFRICQEALTNVARHARASRVKIHFSAGEEGLELTVEDNGRGISEAEIKRPDSLGILGMQERAYGFNGSVELANLSSGGTRVCAQFPLSAVLRPKN